MTVLNFPDTSGKPTDGSFTYSANGIVYSWDGDKWTAVGSSGGKGVGTLQEVTDLGNTTTNSITAGGKIQSGGSPSDGNNAGAYLRQDGNVSAARGSNDAIWAGYNTDTPNSNATSIIRGDGSITAAGNVTLSGDATQYLIAPNVIADSGYTGAKQSLNGDSFTQTATDGSTTTVTIAADGSITAADQIAYINTSSGGKDNIFGIYNGNFSSQGLQMNSNGDLLLGVDLQNQDELIKLKASDGSITSAGPLKVQATGDANYTIINGRTLYGYSGPNNADVKYTLDAQTGEAIFDGTVTANGTVLTRANGTTLDVGDRLEKVDTALTNLKAALGSISDFAELKTALTTALANI